MTSKVRCNIFLVPILLASLISSSFSIHNPTSQLKPPPSGRYTFLSQNRGGNAKDVSSADEGLGSIPGSIFNLVNNLAGAGILTLANGKAKGTGWVPSVLITLVLGGMSAFTFSLIGKACEMTGENDFKGLWSRAFGASTTWMIDSVIALLCTACAVIYSGILGDVFTPLLSLAGVPSKINSRTSNIIMLTIFILFPLSMIKNLSALAFTSILGFSAVAYTMLFIVFRSFDGSYALTTGKFLIEDTLKIIPPSFHKSTLWNFDFSSLVLASNLGMAYVAHYNAPTFYRELRNTSSKRFDQVVYTSFTILALLYIATMSAGYATFGDVCKGNLLLNYHPDDILSTLARVATGFSILFGFPLIICGARESLMSISSSVFNIDLSDHFLPVILLLLVFVTTISVSVEDISVIVGLTGAVMGSFICYICPPLIYSKLKGKDGQWTLSFVPFGIGIASLGVYMTLKEGGLLD